GLRDLVGAHVREGTEGFRAGLVELLGQDRVEFRVPGIEAVDGEADGADQVRAVDAALHGVEVGGRGGGVGGRDVEVRGVRGGGFHRRGRGAAALGVDVERDLAVAAGQVAGGAGAVE